MYQSMSENRSLSKHMEGLLADIMRAVPQLRRFFALDYGGPLYIKIQNHIVGPAMYANEWASCRKGMKCRFSHRLEQLDELDKERFLARFHQQVQKQRKKAWHDRYIKVRTFKKDDLVLLHDSKFEKFPGKLRMHWLGPYIVKEVTDGGAVHLAKLNGDPFSGKVNGSPLKLYMGRPTT
eukprot:PITA_14849